MTKHEFSHHAIQEPTITSIIHVFSPEKNTNSKNINLSLGMCFIEKVEILESWVVFAFITHFIIPYRDESLFINHL